MESLALGMPDFIIDGALPGPCAPPMRAAHARPARPHDCALDALPAGYEEDRMAQMCFGTYLMTGQPPAVVGALVVVGRSPCSTCVHPHAPLHR